MSRFDVEAARAELNAAWADYDANPVRAGNSARLIARQALDEIEALRKHAAPCRFDTKAAREELARIDAARIHGDVAAMRVAYNNTSALFDKALAAIDAGRPEPRPITDADVEEAAQHAWHAVVGSERTTAQWVAMGTYRSTFRTEARAVLEWAASRNLVPVADVPKSYSWVGAKLNTQDEIDRADRLTAYRCAALPSLMSAPMFGDILSDAATIRKTITDGAEEWAHAMLAAERTPDRG